MNGATLPILNEETEEAHFCIEVGPTIAVDLTIESSQIIRFFSQTVAPSIACAKA
jgi:hypothetical protein